MNNKSFVPIHEKYALTVEEASKYFSIGRDKLYELAKEEGCKYILRNGKNILFKREMFENYLNQNIYI